MPVIEVQGKFSYIFLNTALTKIREALHPVIYAFSVIPSILLLSLIHIYLVIKAVKSLISISGGDALRGHTRSHPEHDG